MTSDLKPTVERAESAAEISAWLDEKPSLARFVAAMRRFDALYDRAPESFATRSVLILRNFTIEPIEPLLRVEAYRTGIRLELAYSGYDPSSETPPAAPDATPDVAVVALRLEELAPALSADFLQLTRGAVADLADDVLERVVSLARGVKARLRCPVLVHNFVLPHSPSAGLSDGQDPGGQLNTVRRINTTLAERLQGLDGIHILDVDHLFATIGLREAADARGARVSGAPLSNAALRALAEAQVRHIRALRGPAAKCVIVDCDNTIWGGVVGEDGISGLVLGDSGEGRFHRDLQQNLVDLSRRGIVLAICSHNDEADVLEVLRTHPDCLLAEDDFAAMRINWEDKAENIVSIAEELNFSLEHIVFIDDSPFECEWISKRLPEVHVLVWPTDLGTDRTLDDLGLFDSLVLTDEDRARAELYRADVARRSARAEVATVEDYLRSLEIVATLGRTRAPHLARVAQLTQRTNQFNLTTRRYDIAGLEEVLQEPGSEVIWLDLRDRFGVNGVVGCAILRWRDGVAVIDTLLLSCRVIGRGAEALLVNALATLARDRAAAELVGEYIPSKRNRPFADFYGRLGFDGPHQRRDVTAWRWVLSQGLPPVPDWLQVIDPDGVLNER
jgi:FkbH-like protein